MTMLTRSEAKALLAREVPVTQPPVLGDADLNDLVSTMVTMDLFGVLPSEPGWTETYGPAGLNYAAAKAWERKAGLVANLVTITADGGNLNAGDLHRQCLRMKRQYLSRCNGSVSTARRS